MSRDHKLTVPKLRVVMEDGFDEIVQTRMVDLVAYDKEAARCKWPPGTDAPFLWSTYLAWHVMRRTAQTDLSFTAFQEACVEAVPFDDEDGSSTVDPTQTEATPD